MTTNNQHTISLKMLKVEAILRGKNYLPHPNQPLLTGETEVEEFYCIDILDFIDTVCTAGYAEPGCSDPETCIVTGHWNQDKEEVIRAEFVDPDHEDTEPGDMLTVGDALRLLGCELEWSDEWTTCSECGKLVRTSPDCYSWTPSYWSPPDAGFLLCIECVQSDPSEYIESLVGSHRAAVTMDGIDLEDYGFVRFNEDSYESGWHPGQNDNPKDIAAALKTKGIDRYIFTIDEQSQFYARFSVWVDKTQLEEAIKIEEREEKEESEDRDSE